MASTINPAVSRVSSWQWALHFGSFVFGVAAGATLAFVVIASLAAGVEAVAGLVAWVALTGVVVLLAIARDLGLIVPVPYRDVQVPQVLRYLVPPSLVALSYGTHLGVGFLTRFTYSSHTAFMLALPLALAEPVLIAGAILAFALGKAIVIVAFYGISGDQIADISDHHPTWTMRGLQGIRLANASVSTVIVISAMQLGGVI